MFDRAAQGLKSQTATFSSPNKGWIKNQSLLDNVPGGAEVLDNIFPTAQNAVLRSGKSKHATVAAAVKSLFTWQSGTSEILLAATETDIYDVTSPADPDVSPTAEISSLTSGDWSVASFANSAAEYIILANGADTVRAFDGSSWTVPAITGTGLSATSDFSQVWPFKERLFFIEEDTMSFWYLPVNAIAGTAVEFPLKGVFQLGGALLFGATWSLDSGEGLDDICIFVTTEGEIAVYNGTDPSSASTWALEGVYRIGKPLNKNCWFKAGGDIAIMTEDGIIPASEALRKDRASLMSSAITFPIEDAWQKAVTKRTAGYPFTVTLWHSRTMLVIGVPTADGENSTAFVANARTGAWCRYTGWDIQDSTVFGDHLYFGSTNAIIYKGEDTGNDDGVEFSGSWVPRFKEGDPSFKTACHARFRGRSTQPYTVSLAAFSDYAVSSIPTLPDESSDGASLWGTGVWGTMVWGGTEDKQVVQSWQAVSAGGTSLSPAVSVTSNRGQSNTLEFIALDLVYQSGNMM